MNDVLDVLMGAGALRVVVWCLAMVAVVYGDPSAWLVVGWSVFGAGSEIQTMVAMSRLKDKR